LASVADITLGAVANEFYFIHRFALAIKQTGLLEAGIVGHENANVVDVALVARRTLVAQETNIADLTNAQSAIAFRRANAVDTLTIAPQGALLRDRIVTRSHHATKNNQNNKRQITFRHDILLSPNGETPFEGRKKQVNIFLNCE